MGSTREVDVLAAAERAGQGDVAAFRILFERFYPPVLSYALVRLGRRRGDAEEVAQEVMLALWETLPTFELRHANALTGWIFRTASNKVVDRFRRGSRESLDPADPVGVDAAIAEHTAAQQDVVRALHALPDSQRDVLVYRFMLDLSVAEVASIVGKSEKAVVALQLRGLRQLRQRGEFNDA